MSVADIGRTRFAYSPLTECGESLYMLSSGRIHPLYRDWYDDVRPRLRRTDLDLLLAVTPATGWIGSFYLHWAMSPATTIDDQLARLAELPAGFLRDKLQRVWNGAPVPARAAELFGAGGPRRLAEAIREYWTVAIEPHWPVVRGVLDDDVHHRARTLAQSGLDTLLSGLHADISMADEIMRIGEKGFDDRDDDAMNGAGMLLVPSVFAWPNVVFAIEDGGPARLIYPARGIGTLWSTKREAPNDEALGALFGRSRAEILLALETPRSTTELAMLLGQTPASVSQHLSVLRRGAMAISWRAGRRVLYLRTELAGSIVQANSHPREDRSTPA